MVVFSPQINPVSPGVGDSRKVAGKLEHGGRLGYNARPVGFGMFLEPQEIYLPVHVGVPIVSSLMGRLTGGRT